jgi:hypothetical protein
MGKVIIIIFFFFFLLLFLLLLFLLLLRLPLLLWPLWQLDLELQIVSMRTACVKSTYGDGSDLGDRANSIDQYPDIIGYW